jgi:hypothetical protein
VDLSASRKQRAWSSSTLSYLIWRYGPVGLLILFGAMAVSGVVRNPEPKAVSAMLSRAAVLLAGLAGWSFVALAWVSVVVVGAGEDGIQVIKGSSSQRYPWHMVHSLHGSMQLRTTRFWWLRIDSEPPVLFMTDHPTYGMEQDEPPVIQEIRRHIAEHSRS